MKTKTTEKGEQKGDVFAERVIGVLNEAGDVARKRFEATLPHRDKAENPKGAKK